MRQIWFWVLLVCLPAAKALADNAHDHLTDLPRAKEYLVVKEALFKLKLKDVYDADFARFVREVLGLNPDSRASDFLFDGIRDKGGFDKITFGDFCSLVGDTPEEGLERVLIVKNQSSRTGAYLSMTPLRQGILSHLPLESLRLLYREVFKNMKAAGETKLIVTVGLHNGTTGPRNERLKVALEEAKAAGVELKLLGGIPRKHFLTDYAVPLPRQRDYIDRLIREGLIHGLDITGSLTETERDFADKEKVKEGLLKAMKYCSDRKIILRIHGFERVSKGAFYEGLEAAIREFDGPLELHIGHMRQITERWFKEVLSLPKQHLRIILNANVAANAVLYGDSAQVQAAQVARARAVGLPVWLGADGRGTYDRTDYRQSVERLVLGERALTFPLPGYPTSTGGFNSACFKVGAAASTSS